VCVCVCVYVCILSSKIAPVVSTILVIYISLKWCILKQKNKIKQLYRQEVPEQS